MKECQFKYFDHRVSLGLQFLYFLILNESQGANIQLGRSSGGQECVRLSKMQASMAIVECWSERTTGIKEECDTA